MEEIGIFSYSHTPMLIIDSKSGEIRDGNQAASKFYGYSIEELKRLNISDINILDKQEISTQMQKAKKKYTMYFEFKHRLSNGEIREVEVYSGPIVINGEALLLSIVHDTQYKKELERKINIQESYFKSLYEHSPDAIAILDCEFRFININKSFERIFQYSIEDIKYRNVTDILCNENMYDESTYFKDGVTRGEFVREETQRKRKDGKLVDISFLGYPILYNEEQIGVYAVYTDITKNKDYEEALKKAKEKAEEASKFKTQFIANVAHEIRTPMNGIVGIIDLLEDTYITAEQKEYFEMLRYSAKRLSIIINDVMDIARIEAGKLEIRNEDFNIKQLLVDLEKYFKIQAGKKDLDFNLFFDPDIPSILIGDADKLNQILFNLLANAIKFTEQGNIYVEIVSSDKNAEYIDVKFSVKDTGIGIPKEKVDCLFKDFSQLDSASTKKYSGAGLGLSISKKLVELMGGNIGVVSEYGSGSTFFFEIRFKIIDSNILSADNHCENDYLEILPAMNVLVIEDESINQQIIRSFLEKKNCIVTMAGNGKDALEILSKQIFDLILMDIFMPEIDGFELARMIRKNEKSIGVYTPIIAVTAAVMNEENRGRKGDINAFVEKPFRKEQLYSAIDDVLHKIDRNTVYDIRPLLDIVDGNNKLLREIINEVTSMQYEEEFIGKIEKYARENDIENLGKQIHKFKGSISHFQIAAINDILVKIKDCCRKNEFTSMNQLIKRLSNEYHQLKEFLIAYSKNIRD